MPRVRRVIGCLVLLVPSTLILTVSVASAQSAVVLAPQDSEVAAQAAEQGAPPTTPPKTSDTLPQTSDASTGRSISWRCFAPNVLKDQKQIWWEFPKSLGEGKHWLPTTSVVFVTAGLVALDPHDTPYFRRTASFADFNRVLSTNNTLAGMAVIGVSAYTAGLVRHDRYLQETTMLAAEAILDAGIPALVMRDISRRIPPSSIPPNGNFADSWFRSQKGPFYLGSGGFPSGHTLAAFSMATVFAERYRRHRWIPWVAYGMAGVIGFSRVTNQAHFPSDVFMGAVLGYTVSHYIVLRGH